MVLLTCVRIDKHKRVSSVLHIFMCLPYQTPTSVANRLLRHFLVHILSPTTENTQRVQVHGGLAINTEIAQHHVLGMQSPKVVEQRLSNYFYFARVFARQRGQHAADVNDTNHG
jgi:hypothetical protein